MEITVTVQLKSDFDSTYEEIKITKEEIKQLACNKAKDSFSDNRWHSIIVKSDDDVKVSINAA